ncbi:hypothetical protein [Chitinophaga sp. XS-30]|uniref:hypothetical protein n=1 Tax=Chitinophaga sp. XS-30 TaxID=2604421 RepID=UPI0011DDBCBF|nr:hypothetical protein [Chitinophaga sp. XS-30]QEH41138.1 hypothetical protein FW415_09730 [Chitinophaga sp. XS-30]
MRKLDYLIRKNRRKLDIVRYKQELSVIFDVTFNDGDFLDMEDSDVIISNFLDSYRSIPKNLCKKYKGDQQDHLRIDIDMLCKLIEDEFWYLITSKSDTCGVCKVNVKTALYKYADIIGLDGDSLCVLSLDKRMGICMDYFEEYEDGVLLAKHELGFWGLSGWIS